MHDATPHPLSLVRTHPLFLMLLWSVPLLSLGVVWGDLRPGQAAELVIPGERAPQAAPRRVRRPVLRAAPRPQKKRTVVKKRRKPVLKAAPRPSKKRVVKPRRKPVLKAAPRPQKQRPVVQKRRKPVLKAVPRPQKKFVNKAVRKPVVKTAPPKKVVNPAPPQPVRKPVVNAAPTGRVQPRTSSPIRSQRPSTAKRTPGRPNAYPVLPASPSVATTKVKKITIPANIPVESLVGTVIPRQQASQLNRLRAERRSRPTTQTPGRSQPSVRLVQRQGVTGHRAASPRPRPTSRSIARSRPRTQRRYARGQQQRYQRPAYRQSSFPRPRRQYQARSAQTYARPYQPHRVTTQYSRFGATPTTPVSPNTTFIPPQVKPYPSANPLKWLANRHQMQFPLTIPAQIRAAFGWRVEPPNVDETFHAGVDLEAPLGSPVVAAYAGQVVIAGEHEAYGPTVLLNHDGRHATRYANLSQILVRPGQRVEQGAAIGLVGNGADAIGPHLHFETLQNTEEGWIAVDPTERVQVALVTLVQALHLAKQADPPQVAQEPSAPQSETQAPAPQPTTP